MHSTTRPYRPRLLNKDPERIGRPNRRPSCFKLMRYLPNPIHRAGHTYSVDSISNPQASRSASGMYFEFLFRRAHSRRRVDRTYWSGVSLYSFTICSNDVTVGTTGPMGSGLPQFGFPRRFAISTRGSFLSAAYAANTLVYHGFPPGFTLPLPPLRTQTHAQKDESPAQSFDCAWLFHSSALVSALCVPALQVCMHLLERIHVQVHHVSCRVVAELHVAQARRRQHQLPEVMFRPEERCREVVPSIRRKHPQVRILAHRIREVDHGVRCSLLAACTASTTLALPRRSVVPVPVLIDPRSLQVVRLRAHVLQFGLKVVMKRAHKRAADACIARVVARVLTRRVRIFALEAGVIAAQRLLIAAQQLLAKTRWRNPQLRILHIVQRQSSEARQLLCNVVELRLRQSVTLMQRLCVGPARELTRLLDKILHRAAAGYRLRHLLVVPGDRRIARQIAHRFDVVPRRVRVVVQDRRQQDHAVELNPIIVQRSHQRCRARRAVALAKQILRRVPPLVHRDVSRHEFVERLHVLVDAREILRRSLAHRPRKSAQWRVDEHQ